MSITRWIIFEKFEPYEIPYVLKQPKDVSEEEIAWCIEKQIYDL
jgi:hypothetical protein